MMIDRGAGADDADVFDPTHDLFIAEFAKPNDLQPVNLRALSPFQRALLVIDGTVTKFIEAFTMEPVDVIRIGQTIQPLEEDHEWLELPAGSDVLLRQVILQARYSYRLHAYAVSLIAIERLADDLLPALDVDGGGVGKILLGSQAETRREVLWYGKEHVSDLPEAVRRASGHDFLVRTYRIISGGKPIMLINERFPWGADPGPAVD